MVPSSSELVVFHLVKIVVFKENDTCVYEVNIILNLIVVC